jgi:hypothetical protein
VIKHIDKSVGWNALLMLVLPDRSVYVSSVESSGTLNSEVIPKPAELAEKCGDDAGVVCASNSLISAHANNVASSILSVSLPSV